MKRHVLNSFVIVASVVVVFLILGKVAVSQDRQQDVWGIVKNQSGTPVNGVLVKVYQRYGPGYSRRSLYSTTTTAYTAGYNGWYAIDIVEGFYDILVKEGTSDEGGYTLTFLESGEYPDIVRNIQYGNIITE
ncbi:MAG: hypothetical protein HQ506_12190 [Candidatus Marinimicrobia bacterium]|nr:hypothetical protein [Candidatus Neomarinimicrobiota bacterium]